MNKYISYAALLLLSGFLYSCSFHKLVAGKKPKVYVWNVVHNNPDSNSANSTAVVLPPEDTMFVANEGAEHLNKLIASLAPLWDTRLQYKTFSGKAKMHMEAPEDKQDFTAHIRVRKDSLIWINITAMGGFTFGRILITRDSFFMTNVLQKTAICVPLTKAAKVLPAKVDFSSLQNLILGEPLRDGEIVNATNLFDKWVISVEDTSYIQEITYNKSDSDMVTGHLLTHNPNGPHATTTYSHYEISDGRKMSMERVLDLVNGTDFYKLEMNFVKTSFDEPLEFPFSIPRSYTIKNADQMK